MIWIHRYMIGFEYHFELAADCEHGCPLTRGCMMLVTGEEAQWLLAYEASRQ